MALRIEDYAIIGDCHTAALVGRDGAIDWLCLPRFDAGACFAALLGTADHGRFVLAPVGEIRETRRAYRPGTLVLETTFVTADGEVTVIDCMPQRNAHAHVVRMVVGVRGTVKLRMELAIRFDYGRAIPWVRKIDGGIAAIAGPDALVLYTDAELRGEGMTTVSELTVREGDRVPFVLSWYESFCEMPERLDAEAVITKTTAFWEEWSGRCEYKGPYRDAVVRSLITLKALTDTRTGGIVAAVTTSLPECVGGVRNWDYRFCWVRDATFTLYSLMHAGYREEAAAWREWLLRAVAGEPSRLQIMYGTGGERRLVEQELAWLPGYEGSLPVRIGNAASEQLQLDVYGEIMDSMLQCTRFGLEPEPAAWNFQKAMLAFLEEKWRAPDEGIWEVRGPRRHFTHSKVMAWVAFDRAIKTVESYGVDGPVDQWRATRAAIAEDVCTHGYDKELGAFVQYYGAKDIDAAVLMIPFVGLLPPNDPRLLGTIAAVEKHLLRDGFVRRYTSDGEVDGLPGEDAAFLPCSFWLVDNLAITGREDEARAMFERLLAVRNDVGLLSEEYDPAAKRLLGNFPQAFSHVSLINTAYNLTHGEGPAVARGR